MVSLLGPLLEEVTTCGLLLLFHLSTFPGFHVASSQALLYRNIFVEHDCINIQEDGVTLHYAARSDKHSTPLLMIISHY